jgi:hypothetical protein
VSNELRAIDIRQLTAAEFARMSTSSQLSLLVIWRAQLASRQAIAEASRWDGSRGGARQRPKDSLDVPSGQ